MKCSIILCHLPNLAQRTFRSNFQVNIKNKTALSPSFFLTLRELLSSKDIFSQAIQRKCPMLREKLWNDLVIWILKTNCSRSLDTPIGLHLKDLQISTYLIYGIMVATKELWIETMERILKFTQEGNPVERGKRHWLLFGETIK